MPGLFKEPLQFHNNPLLPKAPTRIHKWGISSPENDVPKMTDYGGDTAKTVRCHFPCKGLLSKDDQHDKRKERPPTNGVLVSPQKDEAPWKYC